MVLLIKQLILKTSIGRCLKKINNGGGKAVDNFKYGILMRMKR